MAANSELFARLRVIATAAPGSPVPVSRPVAPRSTSTRSTVAVEECRETPLNQPWEVGIFMPSMM